MNESEAKGKNRTLNALAALIISGINAYYILRVTPVIHNLYSSTMPFAPHAFVLITMLVEFISIRWLFKLDKIPHKPDKRSYDETKPAFM